MAVTQRMLEKTHLDLEKRISRIDQTKKLILNKNYSGTLNNQKWIRIFSYLQDNNIKFKIATLTGKQLEVDFIRELADSSILMDDSGDFIEFLEIDQLIINKKDEGLLIMLHNRNIEYQQEESFILIEAYKK